MLTPLRRLSRVVPSPWGEALAWSLAIVFAGWLLAELRYRARDPDSALYARIAADLSRRPPEHWIAPSWPRAGGPFREHPVGLFVPPALLGKLGYPPAQAAYAVNALYQVLSLLLMRRLAAVFSEPAEARALVWILQLLPVAFAYRIRANHEPAILLVLVAALYATERARRSASWAALAAAALVGMMLVKGLVAVAGLLACVLWLLIRRQAGGEDASATNRAAWLGLAGAVAAMALVAGVYEAAYRRVTGESFLSFYLQQWFALGGGQALVPIALEKLYNLVWYLGRLFWFSFPWGVALLALAGSASRAGLASFPARDAASGTAAQGLLCGLGVAALYVALFSAGDHRAERYIFPAYYLVGACGAIAAMRRYPQWRRLVERLDGLPLVAVWVWIGGFALHLVAGRLGLPRVKLWMP